MSPRAEESRGNDRLAETLIATSRAASDDLAEVAALLDALADESVEARAAVAALQRVVGELRAEREQLVAEVEDLRRRLADERRRSRELEALRR